MIRQDLENSIFNRLVVVGYPAIEQDLQNKQGNYKWVCKCDCGNYTVVSASNLKRASSYGSISKRGDGHARITGYEQNINGFYDYLVSRYNNNWCSIGVLSGSTRSLSLLLPAKEQLFPIWSLQQCCEGLTYKKQLVYQYSSKKGWL